MTQAIDRPTSGKTVLIVPCYNEAARFDARAFAAFLANANDVCLLFVDDGSRDDTHQLLEALRTRFPHRIAVCRSARNAGKAEAVRRGVRLALRQRPAFFGYWDADLATPLEAVCSFREVLLARPELMLVIGSRVALLGRQIRRRWTRHLLGRAFATAASLVLGLGVYDTQCGAKLFRATPETIRLFKTPFRSRWIFDVEILARFVAATSAGGGQTASELIYEYPLDRWQDMAGSRLAPHDFLFAARDLAAIYWRYALRRVGSMAESEMLAPPEAAAGNVESLPAEREAA
jgi:glycosyltransferase involved in cell wall biosynthesis